MTLSGKTFANDVEFLWYTLFHPFDGFYELRFRRKRNWWLITLIYAVEGILAILSTHYTSFLVDPEGSFGVNNWFVLVTALFPYFLFALANWSVTTLFDGNGAISDIVLVLAYAMIPRQVTELLWILLSHVIILGELPLVQALFGFGNIYFCFLAFSGLCVIHEYPAAKNIVTILATVAAAIVIMFLGMLYLEIMGKIIGFVTTVATEILKRR